MSDKMKWPVPESRLIAIALLFITVLYLALAVGTSLTKRPWWGEAWVTSPVMDPYHRGTYGRINSRMFETQRTQFRRDVNLYKYRNPPLGFLVKDGWHKIFGVSLFFTRAFSVLWGLLALAAWFKIVNILSENRRTAIAAVLLISIDYFFINNAADGRLDMMSVALGSAGLAAYLMMRERDITKALFISHTLVVLSGLTHPNGILPFAGLMFFTFYFDSKRLKLKHLYLSFVPYLIGGISWGLYIMVFPEAFFQQLSWIKDNSPDSIFEAVKLEITDKYLQSYGFHSDAPPIAKLKLLVLAGYIVGVIGLVSTRDIRRYKNCKAMFIITVLYFVIMTLFVGNKRYYYLVYITPLYSACLAMFAVWIWENRLIPRKALGFALGLFILLQLAGDAHRIISDRYHKTFLPMAAFVERISGKDDLVMGSAELAFHLGFRKNIMDDSRLGFYTGEKPDVIVTGLRYYNELVNHFKKEEPEVYLHVKNMLKNEYKPVYKNDYYMVSVPSGNNDGLLAVPR